MRTGQPSTYLLLFMDFHDTYPSTKILHCCKIHTYSVANVFLCLSCIMISIIARAEHTGPLAGAPPGLLPCGEGGGLPAPCDGFKWINTRKAHNITVHMKSSDA